jgi:hypothetical membrane protein
MLWKRIAVISCLTATIGDFITLNIFVRFYPGYDPDVQPISALGAKGSPVGQLVSVWWICLGLLFFLFALAYRKVHIKDHPAFKAASFLLMVYAIGEQIGSGLFPANHLDNHLTMIGWMHNILGGAGVIALMAFPFVLMKVCTAENQSKFNWFLKIFSVTGILFFLLFSISRLSISGLQEWHGLFQRMFVADYYIILIAAAVNPSFNSTGQISV